MTALANNSPRNFAEKTKQLNYPLSANKIYEGSILSVASAKAQSLAAAESFLGIAQEFKDNATSRYTHILVCVEGILNGVAVTGASSSSIGSAVYASDNNTLTLTSTGNSTINGKVVAYDSVSGTFSVSFKASAI